MTKPTQTTAPLKPSTPTNMMVVLCLIILAWSLFRQHRFFHDDEFIELRYAKNLIDFGEPVWNRGEWVEGFTSTLHLLLVGLLGSLGVDLQIAARTVNFLALGVTLTAVASTSKQQQSDARFSRYAGLLLVAGASPLAIWTWGGLEAVLACSWIALAMLFLNRSLSGPEQSKPSKKHLLFTGCCFGAALLTRPDCVVLAGGACLGVFLYSLQKQSITEGIVQAFCVGIPVALVQAILLSIRWELFADFAPNTYYAKIVGIPALHRIQTGLQYLWTSSLSLPALPALLFLIATRWRVRSMWQAVLYVQMLLFPVYVCWVGGDHMTSARFFVPLLPVMAALCIEMLNSYSLAQWRAVVVWASIVLTSAYSVVRGPLPMDGAAWIGRIVGDHMENNWPANSLVALNTAGAPAYHAPSHRFIDMLGLNDRHIARRIVPNIGSGNQSMPGHAKGDGAYVLSREPDFIITGMAQGEPAEHSSFLGDKELSQSAEFARCYEPRQVEITGIPKKYLRDAPHRKGPISFVYYERTCQKSKP